MLENALMTEDSNVLISGEYEYSYGVLSLSDQGTEVPFELSVGGTAQRVEYQTIGEA